MRVREALAQTFGPKLTALVERAEVHALAHAEMDLSPETLAHEASESVMNGEDIVALAWENSWLLDVSPDLPGSSTARQILRGVVHEMLEQRAIQAVEIDRDEPSDVV